MLGAYAARQCARRVHNDHDSTLREPDWEPDELLQARLGSGVDFERVVRSKLADALDDAFMDLAGSGLRAGALARATMAAMRRGVPVVGGGRLPADRAAKRVGKPDLPIRAEGLGDGYLPGDIAGYLPGDIKAHKVLVAGSSAHGTLIEARPVAEARLDDEAFRWAEREPDLSQLAHYRRLLVASGVAPPPPIPTGLRSAVKPRYRPIALPVTSLSFVGEGLWSASLDAKARPSQDVGVGDKLAVAPHKSYYPCESAPPRRVARGGRKAVAPGVGSSGHEAASNHRPRGTDGALVTDERLKGLQRPTRDLREDNRDGPACRRSVRLGCVVVCSGPRFSQRSRHRHGLPPGPGLLTTEPHFSMLASAMAAALAPRGYGLHLYMVGEKEKAELDVYRNLSRRRLVLGALMTESRVGDKHHDPVRSLGLPAVLMGYPEGDRLILAVHAQLGDTGVTQAAWHLVGLGHRRVANVAGPPGRVHTGYQLNSFVSELARLDGGLGWSIIKELHRGRRRSTVSDRR